MSGDQIRKALAPLPRCKFCGVRLVLRPGYDPASRGNGQTTEQRVCGIWYDHPPHAGSLIEHTGAVLLPTPGGPADLPDGAVTVPSLLTPDEYMAVLEGRLADWEREHRGKGDGRLAPLPPLLSWLVQPGDELLVDVDAWEAQENARRAPVKRARTPRERRPVDVDALKAERDRLVARRDALWNSTDPGDTAAISASRKVRARQRERFDRSIDKGLALCRRIDRLNARIDAEEAKCSTPV